MRPTKSFRDDLLKNMGAFREHLSILLHSAALNFTTPIEVSRSLNIDNKMGWKIHRIITDDDLFFSAQHMPKPAAFSKLVEKCRSIKVNNSFLKTLQHTYDSFDNMVKLHAGDRSSFDLMASSCSLSGSEGAFTSQEKAAFKAYSYLLGMQASTQFLTWVFIPVNEDTFDILSIRGFLGVQYNRPNVPLILEQPRCFHDDGETKWQAEIEPLDIQPITNETSPPFYTKYCSKPLVSVSNIHMDKGRILYEFESPRLGLTGKTDIILAQLSRNMKGIHRSDLNLYREVQMRMRIPVENAQLDLISHRDITSESMPELNLFGDFLGWDWGSNSENRNPNTKLPLYTKLNRLAPGINSLFSNNIPFYTDMLQDAARRLNINLDDYIKYRAKLQNPILPSTLNIRDSLPE